MISTVLEVSASWGGMALTPANASGAVGFEKVRKATFPSSSSTEVVHWPEERAKATRAGMSAIGEIICDSKGAETGRKGTKSAN